MKKKYKKPIVAVERFQTVNTTEARDCSPSVDWSLVTLNDIKNCAYDLFDDGTTMLFLVGIGSPCKENGEEYGVVCYNNPSEDMLLFRS